MAKNKNPNKPKAEQWSEFYEEFQHESQRGAVLVGAAFLDEHLRQVLSNFMIEDEGEIGKLSESRKLKWS